jgi:purine nucleosidase
MMVGLEICRGEARWLEDEISALASLGTERARVASALLGYSLALARQRTPAGVQSGASVPDGVAMVVALEPAALTQSGHYFVDVETHGELTTGETVVDRRGILGHPPNATVAHAIDTGRFKDMVREACG